MVAGTEEQRPPGETKGADRIEGNPTSALVQKAQQGKPNGIKQRNIAKELGKEGHCRERGANSADRGRTKIILL